MNGWIALHRKLEESYIWDLPLAQKWVAITIFLAANWRDRVWVTHDGAVPVPRGEMVTSIRHLAVRAKVSEGCVRRALKALERGGTVKVRSTHSRTHITVLNYAQYQDPAGVGHHTDGSPNGRANGSPNGRQLNKGTTEQANKGDGSKEPPVQSTLPLDAVLKQNTPNPKAPSPATDPRVAALWAYQTELRKAAVPRSRALELTPARAKAVLARLAERPADSAVEDARHVLEVYAAEARSRRPGERCWFDGATHWIEANFARALGQPAPAPTGPTNRKDTL